MCNSKKKMLQEMKIINKDYLATHKTNKFCLHIFSTLLYQIKAVNLFSDLCSKTYATIYDLVPVLGNLCTLQ